MPTTLPTHSCQEAVDRLTRMGFSRSKPAVSPDAAVDTDGIVCLFDGVRRKHLTTYLKLKFGITPEEYRHFWCLREDYPVSVYGGENRDEKVFSPPALMPTRLYA